MLPQGVFDLPGNLSLLDGVWWTTTLTAHRSPLTPHPSPLAPLTAHRSPLTAHRSPLTAQVDYYHFGTCEISDGSYFCGDHSCSTYKHVGAKDVVENLEVGENTMTLQSTDVDCSPSTDWFTSAHGSEECQELCLSNGYTYAIVHPDLSCKCAGASECNVMNTQSLGTWLIYKKSTKPAGYNRHAQPQTDGFVNRMDNTAGQYEKIDDHWLSETDISSRDVLRWLANMVDSKLSHGPEAKALYVTPWHLQRNIVADGVDSCVKACDRDATCGAEAHRVHPVPCALYPELGRRLYPCTPSRQLPPQYTLCPVPCTMATY